MEKERLEEFRQLLQKAKDELLQLGQDTFEPNRVDATSVPDEDTQPLTEMSQVISSRNNRTRDQKLVAIEQALGLIQNSPEEYGECLECEEPIEEGRLRFMPWTRFCVECQAELNDEKRGGRRRHVTDYKQ